MTDGWGTLTFHIPNPLNQNIATWKARRFGEKVEVFDDSSNLLWDGVIVKIGTGDPLKISCMGIGYLMTYDKLTVTQGTMLVDSVLVNAIPTTATLECKAEVEEGESLDPGWTLDQWGKDSTSPDRYAIISDETLEEDNHVEQSSARTLMQNATETNAHTDTQTWDGTDWQVETHAGITDMKARFAIALDEIAKAAPITKIKIELAGSTRNTNAGSSAC